MGDPIVTRRIQCTRCGAAHSVLDDALVVVCEHCGAFVALQAEAHWGGARMAERYTEQLRALVEPSWADARKLQAQLGMAEAQAQGDREQWRLWAREYHALLPSTDPAQVVGDPNDPRQMERWVRQAMKAAELSTFDPGIRAAQGRFASAAGSLYRDADPIAAAHATLHAAEQLYRAMFEHPDYPQELAAGDPSHMAREMLRSTLIGAATMLGPGVVTRIRQQVLGDETTEASELRCGGCGGSLPADHGTQRCHYCGGLVEVATDDPWVSTMVGLWQTSRGQASDDAAEAMLVITLGLSSYFSRRTVPPVASMLDVIAAGPAWLPAKALHGAIDLMRQGYASDPSVVTWLAQLGEAMEEWVPQGTRPEPVPRLGPRPVAPPTTGDLGSDPWVVQTLAQWEHGRSGHANNPAGLAMTVLGFMLSPFHLGGSISVDQALAFMERVEPRPERDAMIDAVDLMLRAEATPVATPMLEALAEALRRRG